MKVLVYGISNEKGGISEFMMGINKELIKRDILFDYIIQGSNSIYEEQINSFKGKFIYYNYTNYVNRITNIYKIIKDGKDEHDIFYYNTSGTYFIFPVLFAYLFGYKIISHAHAGENKELNFIYKLFNRINRPFLNFVSKLKFSCSDVASKWVFANKGDVIQINNSIDLDKYSYNQITRTRKREELNIGTDDIVLISVGRVEFPKNQKFLIDVMNQLSHSSNKKYRLLIVGVGNDIENLMKYSNSLNLSNIYFLGSRDDVNELLNASDVFLLPSFYEGFPIVSVEAQASGLTCLLSNQITKQANITGLVKYLPINSISPWVNFIEKMEIKERKKYDEILIEKGFSKEYINTTIFDYINSLK